MRYICGFSVARHLNVMKCVDTLNWSMYLRTDAKNSSNLIASVESKYTYLTVAKKFLDQNLISFI